MTNPTRFSLLRELRRRRVFRVAGLYVVGVWLLMQAANILFPAWGIPDAAIRFLLWAGLLGFPISLLFGWIFEITPEGIRRTQTAASPAEIEASLPLRRTDYLILSAFVLVIGLIVVDATGRVIRTAPADGDGPYPRPAEMVANSLAVLPFASLSADPEHEYFADGISEEILNRLAAFGELKVMARTSSFVFKDSGYDIARITGLLGVEYLLQGSVRRDDGKIRINATLLDRAGFHIWNDTFDRPLGGIFALQDEIAEAVATSIVPQIAPPATPMRLPDLEAYEQYLIGRELMTARTPGWFRRALEHFSRAIELDPDFAEPYAERAIVLSMSNTWSEDYDEVMEGTQRDVNTALALKPNLARAHAAQVMVQWGREPGKSAVREQLLLHVLALDPNMVDALNWLAISLVEQGRRDEAQDIYRRAVRIDPLAPAVNFNLAMADVDRGNVTQAEARLLRLLEAPEPADITFNGLAGVYQRTGRLVDAVQIRKRWIRNTVEGGHALSFSVFLELVKMYAELGMWEQVEHWQEWAERRWPDIHFVRLHRSMLERYADHVDPEQFAAGFRAALADAGAEIDQLPLFLVLFYGELQALSGEYDGAIATLEPLAGPGRTLPYGTGPSGANARHALAWAWLQTGQAGKAAAILEPIDTSYSEQLATGQYVSGSDWLAYFALNTLLLGDDARAITLLEHAVDAGWRDYYLTTHDARWAAVRDQPTFKAIMARVKADIDVQRLRMEEIDATDDFRTQLDAALAGH